MGDLLTQYNIGFYKTISENGNIRYAARGGGLADFLNTFKNNRSIQEGLAYVDYYLGGGIFDYEKNSIASEAFTAWLGYDSVDIYPNIGDTELLLQTIPLKDFKSILQQWLLFLKG